MSRLSQETQYAASILTDTLARCICRSCAQGKRIGVKLREEKNKIRFQENLRTTFWMFRTCALLPLVNSNNDHDGDGGYGECGGGDGHGINHGDTAEIRIWRHFHWSAFAAMDV